MNRYSFPKAVVDAVIQKKDPQPNFMKKHGDSFTIKKGKLFYDGKLVVPNEERDAYLRNVLFSNRSTMPFGRDSLYHMLKKTTINIPKRYVQKFLKAQEVIVKRTARPKKQKREFVYTRKRAGIVSADLAHIRHADVPKGYMPTRQDEDKEAEYDPEEDEDVDVNKIWKTHSKGDRYFYNMVDIYTGFLVTEVVGTKDHKVIAKATDRLIDRMGKALGVPVREVLYDKGTEFNKSVKDLKAAGIKTQRMITNAVVEAKNAILQKAFYTIVAQKRAGFLSSVNQAVQICNNTRNRKVGMTPNEAVAKLREGTAVPRVKKKVTPILKSKAYPIGTLVRAIGHREKEKEGFKTYKGKHYSKVKTITAIRWYQGYPKYTLDNVTKDKSGRSELKWHDELTPAEHVDKKTTDIVKGRKSVKWDYMDTHKVDDRLWYRKKYFAKVISLKPLRIVYKRMSAGALKFFELEPKDDEITPRELKEDDDVWYRKYEAKIVALKPLRVVYKRKGKFLERDVDEADLMPRLASA